MITAETIRAFYIYNPESGLFSWRKLQRSRKAGALGWLRPNGYRVMDVHRRKYLVHRLAWLYVHGDWPDGEIDHVNRDKDDNRIANLRVATKRLNGGNRGPNSNNRFGFKGVVAEPRSGRWVAHIKRDGASRYLGTFDSPDEAHAAYMNAATAQYGAFAGS